MFQKSRILQSGCNSLDCLIGETQVSVESGCNKSMSHMSGTISGELHHILISSTEVPTVRIERRTHVTSTKPSSRYVAIGA